MKDPRVSLKNILVAGVLAFLIPGAGHWYQGRRFKATIFTVGILTLFFWGMVLGNWQPVYSQLVLNQGYTDSGVPSTQTDESPPALSFTYGYGAQFLVGLPALPALVQEMRFRKEDHDSKLLLSPIESPFSGLVIQDGESRYVTGQLIAEPVNPEGSRTIKGTLTIDVDGASRQLLLGGTIRLGRDVFGSPHRDFECDIVDGAGQYNGEVKGAVGRSFFNWYQAPRDNFELDRLHGDLSREFDIATVFTWIAGLLNLLAIWDAVDGPAYGYGDEKREDDDDSEEDSPEKKSP